MAKDPLTFILGGRTLEVAVPDDGRWHSVSVRRGNVYIDNRKAR